MSSSTAERARQARRRRALGVDVHQIELDRYQIRQLIEAGLVSNDAIRDRYALAEQLGFAVEELLTRHGVTGTE